MGIISHNCAIVNIFSHFVAIFGDLHKMNNIKIYTSHNLANLIKCRAKEQKIALSNMLSDLSLGSNTMSAMYHGKAIAFDSLARIADYLDCSVDYLLGRTDNPNAHKKP